MNKRKRNITVLVLAIFLVVVLVGRVVAMWMQTYLEELGDRIGDETTAWTARHEEILRNEAYVERWDAIRGFLGEALDTRANNFISHLESLAEESAVEIEGRTPLSARPIEASQADGLAYQVKPFQLDISCDVEGLAAFLALLDEEPEHLLRIEHMKVSSNERRFYDIGARYSGDLPSSSNLKVEMTLTIPASSSGRGTVSTGGELR